jgi:hypothetical protein
LKITGNPVEFDYIVDPAFKTIDYEFVEMTTERSTGSGTYADVQGAIIEAGNFTAGKKYLLVFTALGTTDNANEEVYIKAVHGGTDFAQSEMILEPDSSSASNDWTQYTWFTVWEPSTAEDIKLQWRTVAGGNADLDQATLFMMNLSDDLDENIDWFYDEVTANTALPNAGNPPVGAWSATNNAEVTLQPGRAGDDWLVMGTARIDEGGTGVQHLSRIQRTGEATSVEPQVSKEREIGNQFDIQTVFRVFNLGAVENTFTQQSAQDGGGSEARTHSGIFVLNLDKFKSHVDNYDATPDALGTADYGTTIETINFTPEKTGDVWIMGQFVFDNLDNAGGTGRLQVNGADQPPGQTTADEISRSYDASDELPVQFQTVESLDGDTTYTIDIDGDEEVSEMTAGDNAIFAVTMMLEPKQGATGSAIIKRVQANTLSLTGQETDVTLTNAVDTSKAFLVFSYTVDDPGPTEFLIRGNLTSFCRLSNCIHFMVCCRI